MKWNQLAITEYCSAGLAAVCQAIDSIGLNLTCMVFGLEIRMFAACRLPTSGLDFWPTIQALRRRKGRRDSEWTRQCKIFEAAHWKSAKLSLFRFFRAEFSGSPSNCNGCPLPLKKRPVLVTKPCPSTPWKTGSAPPKFSMTYVIIECVPLHVR